MGYPNSSNQLGNFGRRNTYGSEQFELDGMDSRMRESILNSRKTDTPLTDAQYQAIDLNNEPSFMSEYGGMIQGGLDVGKLGLGILNYQNQKDAFDFNKRATINTSRNQVNEYNNTIDSRNAGIQRIRNTQLKAGDTGLGAYTPYKHAVALKG